VPEIVQPPLQKGSAKECVMMQKSSLIGKRHESYFDAHTPGPS